MARDNRLVLLLFFASAGAVASAQTFPAVDAFAGYSYTRIPEEPGGLTAAHLNGWNGAVKLNFRPRAGLVLDFGGSYGRRRMVPTAFQPHETYAGAVRQHTFLLGPEIRLFRRNRWRASARALIGAVSVDTLELPLKEPFTATAGEPPVTGFTMGCEKPLAGALGGNLDYRITNRLSLRLFQADLLVVSPGASNVKRLRVSSGVLFTFDAF